MRRTFEDQDDWIPVAHESEVSQEGDFLCLPWRTDGELTLMRQGGQLVAFNNRCHHRGARIFDALTRGNQEPRCSYHARLATADNVVRYETFTFGGFVFCGGVPYRRTTVPQHTTIDDPFGSMLAGAIGMKLHSEFSMTMDCHWTVAVENALDHEHVRSVHTGSLSKLLGAPCTPVLWDCGWSYQEFDSRSPTALDFVGKTMGPSLEFDYAHALFFPNACVSSTRGWTYSLQNYFPRADGKTTFLHRLFVPDEASRAAYEPVATLNRKVFEEDAAVCAKVAPWFAGQTGPGDERLLHFRRYLRTML